MTIEHQYHVRFYEYDILWGYITLTAPNKEVALQRAIKDMGNLIKRVDNYILYDISNQQSYEGEI